MKRATEPACGTGNFLAISIHALVKRATKTFCIFGNTGVISIHALVKRATCAYDDFAEMVDLFQSTPS